MQSDKTHPLGAGNYAETGSGNAIQLRRMSTRRERFLSEIERVLPWSKLREMVAPVYADPKSRRAHPLEMDRMLRIYFLQRWYGLSDAAVHDALRDSRAMHAFACVGLMPDRAPEEIAICGFRLLLEEHGLGETIVRSAERHLQSLGLAISRGAIVDASFAGTRVTPEAVQGGMDTRQ